MRAGPTRSRAQQQFRAEETPTPSAISTRGEGRSRRTARVSVCVWRKAGGLWRDKEPLLGQGTAERAGEAALTARGTVAATGNRLLDLLPSAQLDRLRPHLAVEALALDQTLQEHGKPVEAVIFPTSGMISIVAMMRDGASVEVGLVGREGMLGVQAVLGDEVSLNAAMVQMPGSALRMPADILEREAQASPQLHAILLRYVQAYLNSATQSAACNRAHLLEQRLARWLLTARDRAGTDRLPLTHELIATMLGVRRAGVTVAAQSLQSAGFIHYAHGRITIADREGLAVAACECYEVTRREYARLLGVDGEYKAPAKVLEFGDQPRT